MANEPSEKSVRKNITFPPSFQRKLEKLRGKRPGKSDSEILREAVVLLEACSNPDAKVILRDKDGNDTEVKVV